jgi:hypothetical protein
VNLNYYEGCSAIWGCYPPFKRMKKIQKFCRGRAAGLCRRPQPLSMEHRPFSAPLESVELYIVLIGPHPVSSERWWSSMEICGI